MISRLITTIGNFRHVNWLFQVNSQIPRHAPKNVGVGLAIFSGGPGGMDRGADSVMDHNCKTVCAASSPREEQREED